MSLDATQIEREIRYLSVDEKLWLMEKILHQLRDSRSTKLPQLTDAYVQAQIMAMANDPAIQAELKAINEEFTVAESDGLQRL